MPPVGYSASTQQPLKVRPAAQEFGFKILAHLMPDLPGSSAAADVVMIDDVLDGSERVRCR